jgi:hypothetical protein
MVDMLLRLILIVDLFLLVMLIHATFNSESTIK